MNHRTVLWTLVLFGSVAAAHGQTPGNSFQATLSRRPGASGAQCSRSAAFDSSALSPPRSRCRLRATRTRSRTEALDSPGEARSSSSDVSAGTSICRSSRSSTGPLTRDA